MGSQIILFWGMKLDTAKKKKQCWWSCVNWPCRGAWMRLFVTSKVHICTQILGSDCQQLLSWKFMSPGICDIITKVYEFDELRFVEITHYLQPVIPLYKIVAKQRKMCYSARNVSSKKTEILFWYMYKYVRKISKKFGI